MIYKINVNKINSKLMNFINIYKKFAIKKNKNKI